MPDHKIDLTRIQGAYDFESLVTNLIFFHTLLSVDSIKNCTSKDIFWVEWQNDKHENFYYRFIFVSPQQQPDGLEASLKKKFDQKIAPDLSARPDHKFYLFLNTNLHPDPEKKFPNLEVSTADDISEIISKENWWPIFHKFFEGGMHIKDAEECEFLKAFAESLAPAVEGLSIKETTNVISWVKYIAFYRPKETLAFCHALFDATPKDDEVEKHLVFGELTLNRMSYLEELTGILEPIAAHKEQFGDALELLLRISTELDEDVHPWKGYLSKSVENLTGYYYGRDFLVKSGRAIYDSSFNQETLDVVERMLQEETDIDLLFRCLAVPPNLLKMKVVTSEWSGDKSVVTWREYRLPLNDKNLIEVRRRALHLMFKAFEESKNADFRHRCLFELQDVFRHISLTPDLESEFKQFLTFINSHSDEEDPYTQNWFLEILELLAGTGLKNIVESIGPLKDKLSNKFEAQLYHLLFGKKSWELSEIKLEPLVDSVIKFCGNDHRKFIQTLDSFYNAGNSYAPGMRIFLQTIGISQTDFARKVFDTFARDLYLHSSLSTQLIRSLGYLLCGIRLHGIEEWQNTVEVLRNDFNKNSAIFILTSLQLHEYEKFETGDLETIESLIESADDEIRILASETLWYFYNFGDYSKVLKIYEKLAAHISQDLASSILKGLAHGIQEATYPAKWADVEGRKSLKDILFVLIDFPKIDWDTSSNYYLELLLRQLWKHSTDDLLEFFQLRLEPERTKRESYDPLPYELGTLFQRVSDEKQNEFVSRVLEWDVKHYGIYWIARLIGLACNKNVQPATLETLHKILVRPQKSQLLLIAKLLDQIPLGDTFYELSMRIVKKGYGRKEIRSQLYSSFISTTGGSRKLGQPFPSHVQHMTLIEKYRTLNKKSKKVQTFLDSWSAEIEVMMQRDEEEDLER